MPSADALTTLEPQPATARLKGWRTRDAAYRAERCRWFSLAELVPASVAEILPTASFSPPRSARPIVPQPSGCAPRSRWR